MLTRRMLLVALLPIIAAPGCVLHDRRHDRRHGRYHKGDHDHDDHDHDDHDDDHGDARDKRRKRHYD